MSNTNPGVTEQLSVPKIISVFRDVIKRWWLILSVALVAAMAAFVMSDAAYVPQYKTTTTFVATSGSTSSVSSTNLAAANSLASVFTEILNSSLLMDKVLEQVGIDNFNGTVSGSVIAETNLLTMTVTGTDARTVFLVSRAIIENHHIVSGEVLGINVLEVLQEPVVPVNPSNASNADGNMKRAALLAAAAVCALLALRSYTADKIRSRDEADSKLGCRILGEVYHERKARSFKDLFSRKKKSILISDPLTGFLYTEAIHKLSGRVEKCRHKGEHVIMVTSCLENEGKSTVAVNLALSLVKKGKKVLLVDCDLRKPACHMILGAGNKTSGVIRVLQGKATLQESVRRIKTSGLYFLEGGKSLQTAANLLGSAAMEEMLRQAKEAYDFVIVDTPPMSVAPDAETLGILADASILVVRQNTAMTQDLEEAIAVLEKSNAHLLGCVLNNVYGSGDFSPAFTGAAYSYGYNKYGHYGRYGKYGRYGRYGYGKR